MGSGAAIFLQTFLKLSNHTADEITMYIRGIFKKFEYTTNMWQFGNMTRIYGDLASLLAGFDRTANIRENSLFTTNIQWTGTPFF